MLIGQERVDRCSPKIKIDVYTPLKLRKVDERMPPVKACIIGKLGMLGKAFYEEEKKRNPSIFGTQHKDEREPFYLNLKHVDLSPLPIAKAGYTHAIIAAANGVLSKCERQPEETFASNVEGVLKLASLFVKEGITPVVFSSSYVFDGREGNYREDSPLSPLNEYGRQNAVLEQRMQEVCGGNCLILRLNKVFSLDKRNVSFFDEIAERLTQNQTVLAASDQFLSPISAPDVVKAVLHLQRRGEKGLFNLSGRETKSRFSLAKEVAAMLGKPLSLIQEISIDDLGDGIARPKQTSLCLEKFFSTGAAELTSWEVSMKELMDKWTTRFTLAATGRSI